MSGKRLLAKLTRPRLHGAVARERLFSQLDEARKRRAAVCVVGPPGAGKTTLVASWLDARNAKGIWYQIDPGDADLATFFHYLGQAAGSFVPKGRAPMPALTPEYQSDVDGFSRRFFRELFARLPEQAVLVLDNYQEITPEQRFHDLVAAAVDEVPAGMVLVVISRREPPGRYARLIANEHVSFVDWNQLKLTLEEAGEIARARTPMDLAEIERLHATCGGWAAGLTLLLEGRRRAGSATADVPEGRDAIFDYFAAQIFARLPEATQRFLVATAFLPQVPVSIARELTGNESTEAILNDLYCRHLFTHRRPGTEPVYWYHALFRTFLRAQAGAVLGTAHIGETLSRAARLLEAGGMFDDAFDLFREAHDWPAATRLIERRARDLLAHGRGQTLREWILQLPGESLAAHAWVRYWFGMSLIPVEQSSASRQLRLAFEQFRAIGDPYGQALAASGIIDSHVFEWADFRPMKHWVEVLEGLLDRLRLFDSPVSEQRIVSSLLLGLLYTAPGHPRLQWCVARVTEMLDEELDAGSKLEAAMVLLAYCNLAYDHDRAGMAVARGRSLAGRPEITPFARLWWLLRLALQLTLQGRYDDAFGVLDEADEIARSHGFDRMTMIASLIWTYRTIAMTARGDVRGVQVAAEHVLSALQSDNPIAMSNGANARFCIQCVLGNEEALVLLGYDYAETGRATGMVYLDALGQTFHGIGLAVTRQRVALADRLEVLRALVRGTCFAHFEIDAEMMEAWDVLRHESRERGLTMLDATLARARGLRWRPGNLFRVTRIHRELLAEAFENGLATDYAAEIVARYRLTPPTCATDRWPWPVKVRTLGRFEVTVDGALLEFAGKAPRKPLALLKAIVALGTTGVPVAALIDALWPDEEGDAARKSLDVTVGRLRKLLGRHEAIVVSDEAVTLNPKLCWVDTRSFLALAEAAATADECRRASAAYGGTFLPGDLDAPWSTKRREGLRNRFIRLVEETGAAAEEENAWEDAIVWYRRGLEADELAESFHQGLMRCYQALGRHAEGMS
ncbi:MAG: hypothetical protein K2Y35_19760, partial [Burkholderiales bacterium]|nr:hypothetical protein [Burkholderiales bacterium]